MTMLEFLRRSKKLTQEALAGALGAGFTGSAISLMESGRLRPSPRQSARLSEFFSIPSDDLLAPVNATGAAYRSGVSDA